MVPLSGLSNLNQGSPNPYCFDLSILHPRLRLPSIGDIGFALYFIDGLGDVKHVRVKSVGCLNAVFRCVGFPPPPFNSAGTFSPPPHPTLSADLPPRPPPVQWPALKLLCLPFRPTHA